MKTEYIRNNQPHFQHIGAAFSVTIMIHDAVPEAWLDNLRSEREDAISRIQTDDPKEAQLQKDTIYSLYDQQLEAMLNAKREQENPFLNELAARCCIENVKKYDGQYYRLDAICVMSNHVHILMDFSIQVPADWNEEDEIPNYKNLAELLGRIKGGTSSCVNKVLAREGKLWMRGYHDRYIRSVEHYWDVLSYIVNNPVKAGIVANWEDYPYTYLHPTLRLG